MAWLAALISLLGLVVPSVASRNARAASAPLTAPMPKRRRFRRIFMGLTAALILFLFAPAAAVTAMTWQPATAALSVSAAVQQGAVSSGSPVVPTVTGSACPDEMVVAARGSSEEPQAGWTDPGSYLSDQYKGVGRVNYDVYKRLAAANPNLHFSLDAVMYPADPVWPDIPFALANYTQGISSGTSAALSDIAATIRYCGSGVKFVLLGYSSGAWIVHRVVHALSGNTLGKVNGVALFGDPEFLPLSKINRDYYLQDINSGPAVITDPANAGIPGSVGGVTGDYCLPTDIVCQVNPYNATFISACANGDASCPHYQYVAKGETANAADFLGLNMPTGSVWPTITSGQPPAGTVQTPYTWTATVKPTARTSYKWSYDGSLPPGLSFSTTGVLSGTPTKAGVYGFQITATSAQGRTATAEVNVTINSGGALSVSPSSLPPATAGTAYKVTLSGSGGYLPYTWHATGTALDHGLQFTVINQDSTTATLSGTPDQAGSYSLSVTLTDAKNVTTTQSYTLTVNAAPVASGSDDWTQFAYDTGRSADNTGETSLGTGNVGNLTRVWSTGSIYAHYESPLEVGGNVYSVAYQQGLTGSYGDYITARSLADGTVEWSTPLVDYSEGSQLVAIAGDTIIVHIETIFGGWRNYYLAGLSLADGTQKWSLHWSEFYNVEVDGDKLIAQGDGFMGVLDAATGSIVWNVGTGNGVTNNFAVGHDIIVSAVANKDSSGNWSYTLEGLSEVDGHVIWQSPTSVPYSYLGNFIVTGSTFYDLPADTMKYEARDLYTGNLLWTTPQYGDESSSAGGFIFRAASDGSTLYTPTLYSQIGSDGNSIETITMRAFANGNESWHTTLPGHGIVIGTPVIANGVVYATMTDSYAGTETTYAFSAATGQILWTSPTQTETLEPPIVAKGHLLVGPVVYSLP